MEIIKSWALSFSAAAVITAVIGFLSPSGAFDKSVKIISALFMLVCFIVPITKGGITGVVKDEVEDISEWLVDSKQVKKVENDVLSALESSAESRISSYLKNIGTDKSEIEIEIKIDETKNIKIKKISITLFEKSDYKSIEEFVISEFGISPEITVCSEG